jgi:hypothetical protein
MVVWLEKRQNKDTVGWWGERSRLKWVFYSSGAWESDSLGSVADGGGADSMPRFWLEKGDDGTKCYRKMKWRQRSHFGFMSDLILAS